MAQFLATVPLNGKRRVFYYEHFTDALKAMPTHPKGTALFNQQTGAEITEWRSHLNKYTALRTVKAPVKAVSPVRTVSTSITVTKKKIKHAGLSCTYSRIL
jgi:hypothetical protein